MLIRKSREGLRLIPLDFFGLAAVAYLGSGLLYGYFVVGVVYKMAIWSFVGCMIGWAIFRPRALKNSALMSLKLNQNIHRKLTYLSFFGVFCMIAFFVYAGFEYISSDKVARSELIRNTFAIRIPFYAALVSAFILHSNWKRKTLINMALFWLIAAVSVVEMNREFLIAVALLFTVRHYQKSGKLLIPKGVWGFVIIILVVIFFLIFLKPLLYLLVLGANYDGGFFNFGETVNWYRWIHFYKTNSVDLAVVQKNDFLYSISALILPYSPVDSASVIWFRDILGRNDLGRTYGYSGVLWLSRYFGSYAIFFAWLFLGYIYSSAWSKNKTAHLIISIALCLVSYRFFRSEWPLVLKTLIWTFLYPSLLFYLISRVVIASKG